MSLFDRITNLVRGMVRSAATPERTDREGERRVEEELAVAEAERKAARRAPVALDPTPAQPSDPDAPPKRSERKM